MAGVFPGPWYAPDVVLKKHSFLLSPRAAMRGVRAPIRCCHSHPGGIFRDRLENAVCGHLIQGAEAVYLGPETSPLVETPTDGSQFDVLSTLTPPSCSINLEIPAGIPYVIGSC